MKKINFIFIALYFICFGIQANDIEMQWDRLGQTYKELMTNSQYAQATSIAEEMLSIDPSSNEARFYLIYASHKSGARLPQWMLDEPWSEGDATEQFYRLLSQDFIDKKQQ